MAAYRPPCEMRLWWSPCSAILPFSRTTILSAIRTVENLQSNLFRKLRVHSRAAALVAAHDLGLLDE